MLKQIEKQSLQSNQQVNEDIKDDILALEKEFKSTLGWVVTMIQQLDMKGSWLKDDPSMTERMDKLEILRHEMISKPQLEMEAKAYMKGPQHFK